jgi:hypothetical protein
MNFYNAASIIRLHCLQRHSAMQTVCYMYNAMYKEFLWQMFQMELLYVDSIYISLYETIFISLEKNQWIFVWGLCKLTSKDQN